MIFPDNPKSLINFLSIDQIDSLIQEEELKQKGYKFRYISDADYVKIYCHPLGIYGQRQKERRHSLSYITDEQIALYSFLSNPNVQTIVASPHQEEILDYVNAIHFLQKRGLEIVKTSEYLAKRLQEKYENIEVLTADINKITANISLILSIAVGLASDGINKLNSLIAENKILLYENSLGSFPDGEYLQDLFEKLKETNLADLLYDSFMSRYLMDDLWDDEVEDQKTNWDNLKIRLAFQRDCLVIDRVIGVNKQLAADKKKTIFLYLSSDYKTSDLFYRNPQPIFSHFIRIDSIPINYHRNSSQLFLRMICEDPDSRKTIDNYKKFKLVLEEAMANGSQRLIQGRGEEFRSQIEQKIDYYRKKYADFSTVGKIDEFKNLAGSVPANNNAFFTLGIIQQLIEEKASHIAVWNKEAENSLNNIKQLIVVKPRVVELVEKLKINTKANSIQRIDVGDDFIFGNDHHMPMLFDSSGEQCKPYFDTFIRHYQDNEEQLRQFVTQDTLPVFENKIQAEEELTLKRCLLLLMLSDSENSRKSNAEYSEYFLKNYIWEKQKGNAKYLLCWVYRRIEDYEGSSRVAREMLKIDNQDARFHHALALALYCQYMENQEIRDYLVDSLKHVDNALELYNTQYENWKPHALVDSNIYGLINTKIYVICLLADHDELKDGEPVERARLLLDSLKFRIKEDVNSSYYYTKSEFLHTEAYLELLEFRCTGKIGKLDAAIVAVDAAYAQTPYQRLKNLCVSLRDEISYYYRKNSPTRSS